eukprot:TRINITY_DN11663_c0_g1_i2.p1 TRINITY_DN11663_c0_g1~~TRINITY_DN11663_c0_g1_i2.p1  ORF type:complete len:444 (+),score=107.27 TRINITY_DN11663_c0_g1_i2:146-1477(+)
MSGGGGVPGSPATISVGGAIYASPHAVRNSPLNSSLRRNSPQLAHVRNSPVPDRHLLQQQASPHHYPPHSPPMHNSPSAYSYTSPGAGGGYPSPHHHASPSHHHAPHSPAQSSSHSSFRLGAPSSPAPPHHHQMMAGGSPQPPQTLALSHTASPSSVSLRQRAALQSSSQQYPQQIPDSPQINGVSTATAAAGDSPLLRRIQQQQQGNVGGGTGLVRLQDSPRLKDNSSHSSPSLKSANGQGSTSSNKIKCVFIGDGAVGKTSLIISYTTNGYPNEYVPTAMDTYHAVVHVDDQPLTLELCDTPGQDDFDTLRPLVYPQADVFLLCFSVVLPSSFHNVREKWIPELKTHGGKVPVVLVGTQSDLREDAKTLVQLRQNKEHPIPEQEAKKLAQTLGCELYIECSSLTQKNLKEVFDNAIVVGLGFRRNRERKMNKKKKKLCLIL